MIYFGERFRILKPLKKHFYKIGIQESLYLMDKDDESLEYCIIDDVFGQTSLSNYDTSSYAQEMRYKSDTILSELVIEGFIEII